MVQAYRDGLLQPAVQHKWLSRIRELWLLRTIEQEHDAEVAVQSLQFKSGFATLVSDKQKMLSDALKMLEALGRFAEGDPTALMRLQSSPHELKAMQDLWRAMKQGGIVS